MSNPLHRPWRANGKAAEPRSVTLAVNAELVATAQAMNIDLTASLEEALRLTIQARTLGDETPRAANCNASDCDESGVPPSW